MVQLSRATSRRTLVPALIVIAALLALVAGIYVERTWRSARPIDAAALFGISLPDVDGREQPLAQWRGKVLVVNWWATWCAPCREEMPRFVEAQRELAPRGLQFVGIAVDQPDKVQAFAKEFALNYPSLIGGVGSLELSKAYGNRLMALPFTVVVDRDGRVAHTQLGPLAEHRMRQLLGKLL